MHWVAKPKSKIVGDYSAFTDGDTGHFEEMSEENQEKVIAWIKANIFPGKTKWGERGSYKLKHDLQHDTKIYMTNNQFKEAMLVCGFRPVKVNELSWYYRIDRKSPICIWYKERPFDSRI